MADLSFQRLGALKGVEAFRAYTDRLHLNIPCDAEVLPEVTSPLAESVKVDGLTIGNRVCIHPMEGWDATPEGTPSEATYRRWQRFGASGAKLIWGGEAVAVRRDGRANPNQLLINDFTRVDLARLRDALIEAHVDATGSADGLIVGLQLTHSGRYSCPNAKGQPEPRVAFRHPILDRRVGVDSDAAVLSDDEVRRLIEDYHAAARIAQEVGYDFVDVKHCHGYLGHEFLAGHTRPGQYGGSFENRTRFLREIIEGIRVVAPGLRIGVRLSAFDVVPFRPDPKRSSPGKPGPGIPEPFEQLLPYRWAFGVNSSNPLEPDLTESAEFLRLLRQLNVRMVNLSAGSPYYNPHVQRPAYYPPSDGYQPPEDPLIGVARQMDVVRQLKAMFSDMLLVGSGYSYLQEFLPNVAQAAVRHGWVDSVGIGRVVLSYPEVLWDAMQGRPIQGKKVCRTFSDCTTAPRNGLPSGCYPLDEYYKASEMHQRLKEAKGKKRP